MRYRVTALTPLLVGDGSKLSPVDYMVWKDQVNILDQRRIFKLLSRGPRLEPYLAQLRRADRLDFASWGGFAQNYAGRRIPFEHPSMTAHWERAHTADLHIPMFCASHTGAFLPGSALKGALRTTLVQSRMKPETLTGLAQRMAAAERPLRRPGEAVEGSALGTGASDAMRSCSVGDSDPVAPGGFRVYLVRVSTLEPRGGKLELAWKTAPHGSVARAEAATPSFLEMASPGSTFRGEWSARPEKTGRLFEAANRSAAALLATHRDYAERAGLAAVVRALDDVAAKASALTGSSCVLNLGWGGGFLSKAGVPDGSREQHRAVLETIPIFQRAIRSGLPFPKTRRIVFLENQPATLPGWVLLEVL